MSDTRHRDERQHSVVEIEMVHSAEWHPEQDGRGKPTPVHILLHRKGQPVRLASASVDG